MGRKTNNNNINNKNYKIMKVAVVMGSTSDWDVMKAACETLAELGIEYEKRVSAHTVLRI